MRSIHAIVTCARIGLLLGLLAVTGLAGCHKDRDAEGKIVITLPSTGGDRMEEMFSEMIPVFEKANPNIRVKRLDIPSASLYVKLQVMIAGKCAPDLVPMMTMRLPQFMQRNAFLPLDDMMAKDPVYQACRPDIYPQSFDGFQKDGKTYAAAYSQNLYGLYYNKTIFDKYNETAPAGQKIEYPNASWDLAKFVDVAKKLTLDTDGDGRIDQFGTMTPSTAFYIVSPVLRRFGAELFNADRTRCTLDDPKSIEAMSYFFGLSLQEHVAPCVAGPNARTAGTVIGGPEEMFMAGKIAMWEAESEWRFEFNRRIKSFQWDVSEPPHGRARSSGYECFAMSITSDCPHPAEAWKFISFLISPEGQKIMLKHRIGIPVLKSLCESPDYFMNPAEPPANKGAYLKTIEYGRDIPALRSFEEIESVVSDELTLGLIGEKSPEKACKDAAAAANKILTEQEE